MSAADWDGPDWDAPAQLRRRRSASWRMEPLGDSGLRDPLDALALPRLEPGGGLSVVDDNDGPFVYAGCSASTWREIFIRLTNARIPYYWSAADGGYVVPRVYLDEVLAVADALGIPVRERVIRRPIPRRTGAPKGGRT